MNINFYKRVATSLILLFILSLCLFISWFSWLILLTIASIISYYESGLIIKKIFIKKKDIYSINFIIGLYFIMFNYIGYDLYNSAPISLIFLLLICFFSDTGGYLVGKLVGGKKLTKISPNKTISGSVGSFLFSLVPILLLNINEHLKSEMIFGEVISV